MIISIRNLNKSFEKNINVLTDINLVFRDGMTVILGHNASGKTTLIRILATLLEPTSGTVTFGDYDLKRHRAAIRSMTGYLPQQFGSFRKMKTWEFLDYSAGLAGLKNKQIRAREVDFMLNSLGLWPVRDLEANDLSIVMKRHLEIAQAVIGDPSLILMDEPTRGLSPDQRLRFLSLLSEKSENVSNIIFSTHIAGDISGNCRDVAVLDKGTVIFHGPPDSIPDEVESFLAKKPDGDAKSSVNVLETR